MAVNMTNSYYGELIMPDGRVIKFVLRGTTKLEAENLFKLPQPKAKVRITGKAK
jgi:hypothetical protein